MLQLSLDAGMEVSPVHYFMNIWACARAGDHTAAVKWLDIMIGKGLEPSAACYGAVLSGKPSAELAKSFVERMLKERVEVNPRELCGMMMACGADAAIAWLYEPPFTMTADNRQGHGTSNSPITQQGHKGYGSTQMGTGVHVEQIGDKTVIRDGMMVGAVLKACAQQFRIEDAEKVLAYGDSLGLTPDRSGIDAVVAACSQKGNEAGAKKWWEEGIRRFGQPTVKSYQSMLRGPAAEQWLLKMEDEGLTDASSFSLAVRSMDEADQRRVLKKLGDDADKVCTTQAIAVAKTPDEARKWYFFNFRKQNISQSDFCFQYYFGTV